MKSSLSILSLFGKMFLLGCFSFFGGQCGIVEAHDVSPCHVSAQERAVEAKGVEPCGQCEHSVSAWSEPIVYETLAQEELPTFFSALFEEKDVEVNEAGLLVSPIIVPPDDMAHRYFKQMAKSIFWQNSDC